MLIYMNKLCCYAKMKFRYSDYLDSPERVQYTIGKQIDSLHPWINDNGGIDTGAYFRKLHILRLANKSHLDWHDANDLTRQMLADLIEDNTMHQIAMLRAVEIVECLTIITGKKSTKMIKAKQKKINTLNKLIPKLRTNMIARQKKQFLKNIKPANLPHDLENLIFTYLY